MTTSRRIVTGTWIGPALCLLVLVGTAVAHPAQAFVVCGPVCDATWTADLNPYIATCDVTVAAGCTITIEAGVEVRFDAGYSLIVDGTLDVNGVDGNLAVFTSNVDPQDRGDWPGLQFVGSSTSTMEYAAVNHADYGIHVDDGATLTIDDVITHYNNEGMYIRGTGPPTVTATGCDIENNLREGVHVVAEAPGLNVNISGSRLRLNGGFEINAQSAYPFDGSGIVIYARNNYWGASTSTDIAYEINDARSHDSSPKVDWCDYVESGGETRDLHCPALVVRAGETSAMDLTDRPWFLSSLMSVRPGGTLRVGSGVQVITPAVTGFPEHLSGIRVDGDLEINGTAVSPVVFTTEGDPGSKPWWNGLWIYGDQASAVIDHATIENAKRGVYVQEAASATLTGVTARLNMNGLEVTQGGAAVATDCTFTDNDSNGIYVILTEAEPDGPRATATIHDSSIHSNGVHDFWVSPSYSADKTPLDASRNWWGTDDPAAIQERIMDQFDESGRGRVDWCEWLDGPGGSYRPMHCPEPNICGETRAWDQTDRPYVLTSDVQVCPTGTLTIAQGVEVRATIADPTLAIEVEGSLDVSGTQASPVTFDSDAATPQSGDWSGLRLRGGGTANVDWAEITHAERGVHVFESATANLNHVTSRWNEDGLYLYGHSIVDATECAFVNNGRYGVYAQGVVSALDPTVTIHHSEIHSNGGAHQFFLDGAFSAPGETVFDAQYNWWGSVSTTTIASRVRDRADSTANATVDWCKYLDSPGGSARDVNCVDLAICEETDVWERTDKPYLITSTMEICPSGTLHIGAGVEVRVIPADTELEFLVQGLLDVNGTEALPVTITSDADTPAPRDWDGLTFSASGRGEIEYADVLYGEHGIRALNSSTVNLTGVTSSRNYYDGLWVFGAGPPTVHATGSSFTDNDRYGMYLRGRPNPDVTITDSSIHSNLGAFDVYTYTYTLPDQTIQSLRNNWWGSTDPDQIGSRIYDYRRSASRPRIDYCAYLDGPGGAPYRDVHCPDLVVCDETVTWDLTDKPYQILNDLRVCPTGTLVIAEGVDVRTVVTYPKPDFVVEGILDVQGTAASGVTLDSDATAPQAEDWPGLLLTTGSTSNIEYATISHADNAVFATSDADVTLTGVTMETSHTGLRVVGAGPPTVHATGCSFTNNQVYGVYLDGAPNPDVTITDSSIHSNLGDYDLYTYAYALPDETVQLARNNWWGGTDPAEIGARIYGHRRSPSRPRIDYCGYLDGPGGVPYRDVHCPDLVACDETVVWDQTDRPYQIVTDLRVCPSGTLEIEAGVEARMVVTTPQPDFLVEGVLDVNGTRTSPVVLTSDLASPQAQDWYGPVLTAASSSDIEYAAISYADNGILAESLATVNLTGVAARHNHTGLRVDGDGPPTVRATRCSFTENQIYGVYLDGAPNPDVTLTANAIHSNLGSWDLYTYTYFNPDTTVVWATDNWWGTTDEDDIAQRIYDHEESGSRPYVHFSAFGENCDPAIGIDGDGDGFADFEDNCPGHSNATQTDNDADGMGNACDPAPTAPASGVCDGIGDVADGYLDGDGDGWGDPCDHRPARADSYPGAPELCDARDNDGDAALGAGETTDDDLDHGIACGDCDDIEPLAHVCACETCGNAIDDDCDLLTDGADGDCVAFETCIVLTAGADPRMDVHKGVCGGATLSGPFDVIRGELAQLALAGGSVDLGEVSCVAGGLDWDRVDDASLNLNPRCVAFPVRYYLGKNSTDPDFGVASSGEPRDTMNPDPVCP